jgi:hypothetical protein
MAALKMSRLCERIQHMHHFVAGFQDERERAAAVCRVEEGILHGAELLHVSCLRRARFW